MLPLLLLSSLARADVDVGSYGRVQASTDARGGQGDPVNVAAHGTRLEEGPYLELDLLFTQQTEDGATFQVLVTPALQGTLFHYDGQWDADLALRNLYASASDFSAAPLTVWAGSRMWRGDDVHLLDFWPLDEVNTVGGGLDYAPGDARLSALVGVNRLSTDEYQEQWVDFPRLGATGSESVLVLDRQRTIAALKAGRLIAAGDVTWRFQAYGEFQALPAGTRVVDDFEEQDLPADQGSVLGAQISAWGWAQDSYVHLWYRRATGLGAYGSLAVPWTGYATDYSVHAAREHLVALAGNTESGRAGIMWGGYVRRFQDADGIDVDVDDRWEAVAAVRPAIFIGEHGYLGLEASHQWLRPDGLNPRTATLQAPQVTKLAVLPAIQPRRGDFARPQIRLQYVLSVLNDDARQWYAEQDVRHRSNTQHFIGVGAEWWLNSKSYR